MNILPRVDEDGVPVFGEDADLTGQIPLKVHALHLPTSTRDNHVLSAWSDPGPEFLLAYMAAGGDENLQAGAAATLIRRALVDTDGLKASYVPPKPGTDEEPDERLDDFDSWSSLRRFVHLVEDEDYRVGKEVLLGLAKWLAQQAMSRKQSPVGVGTVVPTNAPARSPRGRKPARTGSTAKRSPKA